MRLARFMSVAVVALSFAAALIAGWVADSLPSGSADEQRLAALSMLGMGMTLTLGLVVGSFWVLRDRRQQKRSR